MAFGSRAFFLLIFLINAVRLIGLETAPPGFYVDEAAGAAQVLCIKQTGADFFGHEHPLFSRGLGGGFYTAPYVYGEALFTSIFGNSIAAFRGFIAVITILTLLFLYLWVRRKADEPTARLALLFGSITPWAFQFSRIAWDPPLAPFFLMAGLYFFSRLERKSGLWIGSILFALSAYSYPPSRIQALAFLLLIPGFTVRKKLQSVLIFGIATVPLLLRSLDPDFTARARMLALWSDYPMNPYHDADLLGLVGGFISQFFAHLTPSFLALNGDPNLRHSIQTFGMLSYPELLFLCAGAGYLIYRIRSIPSSFQSKQGKFMLLLLAGLFTGIAPAALTWEGVPHALRAIGAWPFFTILAAVGAQALLKSKKEVFTWATYAFAVCFAGAYFYFYFVDYPERAGPWFQTEASPFGQAYQRMVDGQFCADLRQGR